MNIRLVWLSSITRVLRDALLVAVVGLSLNDGVGRGQETPTESRPVVVLRVDYGDGVEKCFTRLPWIKQMTVKELMEAARRHPRGITYSVRGKGPTAFLLAIDDLKNEGGAGKNWMFRVNQQMATQGFAVTQLEAGDEVLWRFQSFP